MEFEVELNGLKWRLNPSQFVEADLFWYGIKDMWCIYHLKRLLAPKSVILDAGANFGYYGIALADQLNRKCVVHSFEPNPAVFEKLKKHIMINDMAGVVYPHCQGLGDSVGTAFMQIDPCNSGSSRIVSGKCGEVVSLVSVDWFVEDNKLNQLDFIKIDVEGYELNLLRGAEQAIGKFKPIILIELHPAVERADESNLYKLMEILRGHGYQLFYAHRKELVPLTKAPEGEDYINAFCIHDP